MGSQLAGELESVGQGHLIVSGMTAIVETWDWPDHAINLYWLAMGKKQVWLDYLDLLERGLTGAELEKKLGRMRVTVYGKMFAVVNGGVLAYILVDRNRIEVARNMLTKMGILII